MPFFGPLWNFLGRLDPFAKGCLSLRDLEGHPIWEYALNTEGFPWRDETWLRPLRRKTIPWNEYSLTVAAILTLPNGQQFDGDAHVSTFDGQVDVPMGGIFIRDVPHFVPTDNRQESAVREDIAAKLSLSVDQIFPIRWQLKVPIEGEATPRTGEFTALTHKRDFPDPPPPRPL